MLFPMTEVAWCLAAFLLMMVVAGAVLCWTSSESEVRSWGTGMMLAGATLLIGGFLFLVIIFQILKLFMSTDSG